MPLSPTRVQPFPLALTSYKVDCYNRATTNSEPPSPDYTYVGTVMPPLTQIWLRGAWTPPSIYNTNLMHPDTGPNQKPNWAPSAMNSTYFALVYTFNFYVSQQVTLNLEMWCDDGCRLYIDGNLVIDAWRFQGPTRYTASATLSPGVHTAVIKYFEGLGAWVLALGAQYGYPFFFGPRPVARTQSPTRTLSPTR